MADALSAIDTLSMIEKRPDCSGLFHFTSQRSVFFSGRHDLRPRAATSETKRAAGNAPVRHASSGCCLIQSRSAGLRLIFDRRVDVPFRGGGPLVEILHLFRVRGEVIDYTSVPGRYLIRDRFQKMGQRFDDFRIHVFFLSMSKHHS